MSNLMLLRKIFVGLVAALTSLNLEYPFTDVWPLLSRYCEIEGNSIYHMCRELKKGTCTAGGEDRGKKDAWDAKDLHRASAPPP